MNAQMVLTMGQEALLMLLMVSAPVLGVVLLPWLCSPWPGPGCSICWWSTSVA